MDPVILFEDNELLVVNKPSGITVNRSDTTKNEQTMQDFSEEHIQFTNITESGEVDMQGSLDTPEVFYKRSGIVHRLDKETSGILLIAKTPYSFFNLQKQFRERTVHKGYTALAHGKMMPLAGEIRVPVGRLSWNRKRFGVIAGGREAVTRYETVKIFEDGKGENYSLLKLLPETGRTHQIRVHLKYTNHPIVSDALYGGRKTARGDRKKLHRLFLHASQISFTHPTTGEVVILESSLPLDLSGYLATLTTVESS